MMKNCFSGMVDQRHCVKFISISIVSNRKFDTFAIRRGASQIFYLEVRSCYKDIATMA